MHDPIHLLDQENRQTPGLHFPGSSWRYSRWIDSSGGTELVRDIHPTSSPSCRCWPRARWLWLRKLVVIYPPRGRKPGAPGRAKWPGMFIAPGSYNRGGLWVGDAQAAAGYMLTDDYPKYSV